MPTKNGPASPTTVKAVMVSAPPSKSVALASKPAAAVTLKVTSSVTVFVSLPSNGGSFTAVIVMTWLAVAVPPLPSLITYANVDVPK